MVGGRYDILLYMFTKKFNKKTILIIIAGTGLFLWFEVYPAIVSVECGKMQKRTIESAYEQSMELRPLAVGPPPRQLVDSRVKESFAVYNVCMRMKGIRD